MTIGIYSITNKENGNIYIGSAVDIGNRWAVHKFQLRKGKHHNIYLQRSWNKYGENSFLFSVLEECLSDDLIIREQFYIDILCPQYNISKYARSMKGLVHTKEAREKMSIASKGNKNALDRSHIVTQDVREKISRAHKGKVFTQQHCENISKSKAGIIQDRLSNGQFAKKEVLR